MARAIASLRRPAITESCKAPLMWARQGAAASLKSCGFTAQTTICASAKAAQEAAALALKAQQERERAAKEAAELAGNITSAYPRGGWQAVVGMWFGISSYVGVRGWLKAKCPVAAVEK